MLNGEKVGIQVDLRLNSDEVTRSINTLYSSLDGMLVHRRDRYAAGNTWVETREIMFKDTTRWQRPGLNPPSFRSELPTTSPPCPNKNRLQCFKIPPPSSCGLRTNLSGLAMAICTVLSPSGPWYNKTDSQCSMKQAWHA